MPRTFSLFIFLKAVYVPFASSGNLTLYAHRIEVYPGPALTGALLKAVIAALRGLPRKSTTQSYFRERIFKIHFSGELTS